MEQANLEKALTGPGPGSSGRLSRAPTGLLVLIGLAALTLLRLAFASAIPLTEDEA